MPTFMLVSLIFCLASVPLFGTAQFLMTRQLADPVMTAGAWLLLAVGYWWPLGAWLFRARRHWWSRLLIGYVLSVPLYFAGLWVAYAAAGYRFAPVTAARWLTYLSASPWFYLYVVLLWLATRQPHGARIARAFGVGIGIASVAAPFVVWASTDRAAPAQTTPVTRITNALVVDPIEGLFPGRRDIEIANGVIVRIVPAGETAPSDAGRVIDAGGGYLLPGLIDVHTHLQTPAASATSFSPGYAAGEVFGDFRDHRTQYLANGITSVRDTGGAAAVSQRLRQALQDRRLAGPRLFTVARLITSPGGHPVATIWPGTLAAAGAIEATNRAVMVREIDRDFTAYRPDALKVIDGTIGRADTLLTEDLVAAAIAAARAHGVPSIVHAEHAAEVWAAVRAGATGIEHIASVSDLSVPLIEALAERKPFVDPTFGEFRLLLRQNGQSPAAIDDALADARGRVKRLADAGVPIVVGTDAPLVGYGSGLHEELRELERTGLAPAEILRIATVNNAAYLGHVHELGRVAPGFRADLLLLSQNPLDHLAALRQPRWTMVGGMVMWETRQAQP